MRDKLFLVILIVIPLLLIVGGAYYFFLRPEPEQPGPTLSEEVEAPASAVALLVDQPVSSPILSFTGERVWYLTRAGRLYRQLIEPGAEAEEYLLPETIAEAAKIIWQINGSNFIIQQNVAGHSRYQFYDADLRQFTTYAENLRQPQFLSGGTQIVYDWVRGDSGHELKVSDSDGENFITVTELFRPDYQIVASPKNPEVVLFSLSQVEPAKLFAINLTTGVFLDLGEEAVYSGAKYSPDGTRVLVEKNGQLVVYNLATRQATNLGINATVTQTNWLENNYELIVATRAGVSKYDVVSGQRQSLYEFGEGENFEPGEVLLHPNSSILLFVDRGSGYLYRVDL